MADNTDTTATPVSGPSSSSDFGTTANVSSAGGAGFATGADTAALGSASRTRFTSALDEARAGVDALRAEAIDRTAAYRARAAEASGDLLEEARTLSGQAREQALTLANESKARASDGLAALGRSVADNAPAIDEMLGVRYGDYARQAARTMQESAAKLESKTYAELGEEAREFVRTNPAAALGIAGVAGYFIARMFGRGAD